MVAMEWQPEGKKKEGRPKTAWRRTVEKRIQVREVDQLGGSQGRRQRKTGLGGERKLQPYAPHGAGRTN